MTALIAGLAVAAISPVPWVQGVGVAMILTGGAWMWLQHYVRRAR